MCRACVGPPGPYVEGVRGAMAARAADNGAWRGEIGAVAAPQRFGRLDSCRRGCGSLNGRTRMAGSAIRAVWSGVAAAPPCDSGRGRCKRRVGGVLGWKSGTQ